MFAIHFSPKVVIKRLVLIAILMAIFVFALSPQSEEIGGVIFLLFGKIIPTAVILIGAYYIAFDLLSPHNYWIKTAVFVLGSFILGLNTNLAYVLQLKNYQPADFTINVVKPILNADKLKKLIYVNIDTLSPTFELITSPLVDTNLGWNEGCMCYYFALSDADKLINKSTIQVLFRGKAALAGWGQGGEASFNVAYKVREVTSGALLKMTITDNEGGQVDLQAVYPTTVMSPLAGSVNLRDPRFLRYTLSLLAHDNFFNWVFTPLIQTDTLYDLMQRSNQKWEET